MTAAIVVFALIAGYALGARDRNRAGCRPMDPRDGWGSF